MESRGLPPSLEEHFRRPRCAGRLAHASGRGRSENPVCDDLLEVEVRLADGRIAEAGFLAHGCSSVIAVASLVMSGLQGMTVEEARTFDIAAAVDREGGLPPQRRHAVAMVARALDMALHEAQR